jgi:uncharacterized protein (DUF1501 family)
MKRREFIKNSGKVIALGSILPGFSISALAAHNSMSDMLAASANLNDNVLVMIQLNGGNDGLNTLIPLDQYSKLSLFRQNILIPESKLLKLNGKDATCLHPSMTGVQSLYNEGKVNFIQGVGYPNQNFSHFRSTDIWLSGSDADKVVPTGWMGRYLNYEFPNFPEGFPNNDMPDPLGIQIGAFVSPVFQGPIFPMAISISNDKDFYDIVNGTDTTVPNNAIGKELAYIREVKGQAQNFNQVIKTAAGKVTTQYTYPTGNKLADQLKIVAKLIKGGLKTKVYMVDLGGFDNHAGQVDTSDVTKGTHATLLKTLSDAIQAFQKDLEFLGIDDRVVGMTMSEFGRRIASNASLGTDHGSALPMMVFGKNVNSGILGANPNIPSASNPNDNLAMQYDFRSVYASILRDWFCVDTSSLQTILLNNYQQLPILKSGNCTSSIHEINQQAGLKWIDAFPNPFVDKLTIEYTTKGGHTMIQLFDTEGKLIETFVNESKLPGTYTYTYYPPYISKGVYYCRFQNESIQQVVTLISER